MPGFQVEEGGMEKLVIVVISHFNYFLSMDRKHVTMLNVDNTEYYC